MEFKITDALFSNTSNQQSGPEDNSLEDESEVGDARDSENVKIAQVVRKRRSKVQYSSASALASKQSEAEEAILAALTLAKFSGGCYCERTIREVLGNTPDTSKALRKLVKDGEVKKSGKGGKQEPFMYSLP